MSIPKWFWVYIKNWACLKKLSMLKPNFEEADGLGNSKTTQNFDILFSIRIGILFEDFFMQWPRKIKEPQ